MNRIEAWASRWLDRRTTDEAPAVTLARRRIYILPTRFGLAFAILVFAMLLGSLNYGANLGFLLTFLMTGLGLVAMHHCHSNLLGIELRSAGARPVFAGEPVRFRVALVNDSRLPRYEIELTCDDAHAGPVDLAAGETRVLRLKVPAETRGWQTLGRFSVRSCHPGRLFRAWSRVELDLTCLVYPRPAPPGMPIPRAHATRDGSHDERGRTDADFAGLRPALPADPPKRIAWKAYARSDELLLKQFSGAERESVVLDWDTLPALDPEAKLRQLTRWCLDAAADGRPFGLRVPGTSLPPGSDRRQLHNCLKVLALFRLPGGGAAATRHSART